jgi:membrane protease YdiL (CAAX protease family)
MYFSFFAILFGICYAAVEVWIYGIKQFNIKKNEQKFKFIIIVIAIGVLEEILFRGVINEIAISIKNNFKIILILAGTISFGVSHLFSGWLQFIFKTILSCFMTLFFILSGTVLVPVLAHAVFNFCIAKRYSLEKMRA